jgi:hypothetical protein
MGREEVVVVISVKLHVETDLAEVVHAIRALGLGFGTGQCGQDQRRQDSDDSDNDQQFDQRESKPWKRLANDGTTASRTWFTVFHTHNSHN